MEHDRLSVTAEAVKVMVFDIGLIAAFVFCVKKRDNIHERIICSVPSTARYLEKQRVQSSFIVTCFYVVLSPVWQDAVWITADVAGRE